MEPVLCAGGVHGVGPSVRGQGKESLFICFNVCGGVINQNKELGKTALVVNGGCK